MLEVVVELVPPLVMHTGVPVGGEPMAPVWTVKLVVRVPDLVVCTRASLEQLTGTYWPRKRTTGWLVSLLHSRAEAVWPPVKPDPATTTTSPLARFWHTGSPGGGFWVQVPAADVMIVRLRAGVLVAAAPAEMAVPKRAAPATSVTTPSVPTCLAVNFALRFQRVTFPPVRPIRGGALRPRPLSASNPPPVGAGSVLLKGAANCSLRTAGTAYRSTQNVPVLVELSTSR
jgi:hypothetical protein